MEITVKDIEDTKDGGCVLTIEADQEALIKFAEVGVWKLLMDAVLELEEISNDDKVLISKDSLHDLYAVTYECEEHLREVKSEPLLKRLHASQEEAYQAIYGGVDD